MQRNTIKFFLAGNVDSKIKNEFASSIQHKFTHTGVKTLQCEIISGDSATVLQDESSEYDGIFVLQDGKAGTDLISQFEQRKLKKKGQLILANIVTSNVIRLMPVISNPSQKTGGFQSFQVNPEGIPTPSDIYNHIFGTYFKDKRDFETYIQQELRNCAGLLEAIIERCKCLGCCHLSQTDKLVNLVRDMADSYHPNMTDDEIESWQAASNEFLGVLADAESKTKYINGVTQALIIIGAAILAITLLAIMLYSFYATIMLLGDLIFFGGSIFEIIWMAATTIMGLGGNAVGWTCLSALGSLIAGSFGIGCLSQNKALIDEAHTLVKLVDEDKVEKKESYTTAQFLLFKPSQDTDAPSSKMDEADETLKLVS